MISLIFVDFFHGPIRAVLPLEDRSHDEFSEDFNGHYKKLPDSFNGHVKSCKFSDNGSPY